MKVRELLELVDAAKPNEITDSVKMHWINDVEGRAFCEIRGKDPKEFAPLMGEDGELSIPDAYAVTYQLYLTAMIELFAGNYTAYETVNALYEAALATYARYVIRNR